MENKPTSLVHPFCDICQREFPLEELYECDEAGEGIMVSICRECELEGIRLTKELQKHKDVTSGLRDSIKAIKEIQKDD